jgi:hypothetical protein
MPDDPRIKRVLKRYQKGDKFSDASVDVTSIGVAGLLLACRRDEEKSLDAPIELDDQALTFLSGRLGFEFDRGQYDYFLHSYVRSEFLPSYYEDPSVTSKPSPESGPPLKIPIPTGMRWISVRPKDGKEQYEAHETDEPKSEA